MNSTVPEIQSLLAPIETMYTEEKGYSLFSGGRDSLATTLLMEKAKRLKGCVYIDTTIENPDTTAYVKEICDKQGWSLSIVKPDISYEELVTKYGFPHFGFHRQTMIILKLKALRHFTRSFKKQNGTIPLYFSGTRKYESTRRFGNAVLANKHEGAFWYAPLTFHTTPQRNKVLEEFRVKNLNPAYKKLGYSGDFCGCFDSEEELSLIEMFYPEVASKLELLEKKTEKLGKTHCRWGNHGGFTPNIATEPESLLCMNCTLRERYNELW